MNTATIAPQDPAPAATAEPDRTRPTKPTRTQCGTWPVLPVRPSAERPATP